MDSCQDERAALVDRDGSSEYANTGNVYDTAEEVQVAQNDAKVSGRWAVDPKDGKLKVNWIYNCSKNTIDVVRSKVTLCE